MSTQSFTAPQAMAIGPRSGAAGRRGRIARRWRYATNAGLAVLYAVMLVWTFTPIYNIVMIALEHEGDVYGNSIVPTQPSLDSFWVVLTQGYWYLENFWHQFGNSFTVGLMTMALTLLIGSLASFTTIPSNR